MSQRLDVTIECYYLRRVCLWTTVKLWGAGWKNFSMWNFPCSQVKDLHPKIQWRILDIGQSLSAALGVRVGKLSIYYLTVFFKLPLCWRFIWNLSSTNPTNPKPQPQPNPKPTQPQPQPNPSILVFIINKWIYKGKHILHYFLFFF